MEFNWDDWDSGGKIIFVAACIAFISLFFSWASIGVLNQNGFAQQGYLFLVLWIHPIFSLLMDRPINRITGVILSALSIAFTLGFINSKNVVFLGSEMNAAGTGAYIFLFASSLLMVGIFKNQTTLLPTIPNTSTFDAEENLSSSSPIQYFKKFIAGQYSLFITFILATFTPFLFMFIGAILGSGFKEVFRTGSYDQFWVVFFITLFIFFGLPFYIMGIIGTWRSANKFSGNRAWPILIKVFSTLYWTIIGIALLGSILTTVSLY